MALTGVAVVLMLTIICSARSSGAGADPSATSLPKTNLLTFLGALDKGQLQVGTKFVLEPEWVGTVQRVYLYDEQHVSRDPSPWPIRFSHLVVHDGRGGRIIRGRMTDRGTLGSYLGSEGPLFTNALPPAQTVSEAKDLGDLQKLLGAQDGFSDGWGDGRRLHWTESWVRFTRDGSERLRYLYVFAMASGEKSGERAHIDLLDVREGFFRPADPASAEERLQFKTGAELFTGWNADRARAREKYPQPLRALVAARETPDDSDLIAYKRALNEIRKNPSPELFRQFTEWVDEGTREIHGMLEAVLFGSFFKLEPWDERQRTVALRTLTEALPNVKTPSALTDLLVLLLQARGGGALKLDIPGTTATVDIKADRFADGTHGSYSYNSKNITPENLAIVARYCQTVLRQRHPDLQ